MSIEMNTRRFGLVIERGYAEVRLGRRTWFWSRLDWGCEVR